MKLLFLANRVPYPPYRGDKLKIFNLATRLRARHELHLLTFAQTEEDLSYKSELEKIFHEVHLVYLPKWKSALNCVAGLWDGTPFQVLYFRSAEMQGQLRQLLSAHKYNAVHVQHLRMAPYLAFQTSVPRILDLPDAFSLYWERRKTVKRGFLRSVFENMEQHRLLHFEKIIANYSLSLVCSQEDLLYLQNTHKLTNLALLPNGVDLNTFAARGHDYTHNSTLLFTGNMDYAPNVDAAVYFVQDILPEVRRKFPDVVFVIAGQRPVERVLALACDYVKVTGFVKNLADTYDSASVVVAPLRFGAGTQNKVLEAMAMGVPVVCSEIGFAGLAVQSGQGAIMETDARKFARSVIDLLGAENKRREVGTAGAEVIKSRFDWNIIALKLEQYFDGVASA